MKIREPLTFGTYFLQPRVYGVEGPSYAKSGNRISRYKDLAIRLV